jgi:DNA mismatch endonuclease (patch repair protein)
VADTLTVAGRSARMSLVRSRGNRATELRLMALMHEHRITGWRRGVGLLGKPDFVFRARKVAVFVDGCFWHGCPRHGRTPKTRIAFWTAKLARNAQRDRIVTRTLRRSGWRVVRVWECGLSCKRAIRTMARIAGALSRNPRRAH